MNDTVLRGNCTIHGEPIGRTIVYVRIARCSKPSYWYDVNVGQLWYLDRIVDAGDHLDYAVTPAGPYIGGDSHMVYGTVPHFSFGGFTGGDQYAVYSSRYVDAQDGDLIFVDEDTKRVARVISHDGLQYDHDIDDETLPGLWQYFESLERYKA